MTPPDPFVPLKKRDFTELTKRGGSSTPALIYLYDPDANLCQLINPTVSKLCQSELRGVNCYALNVDKNKDLTFELKVTSAPSFVILHREKEIRRLSGIDYDDGFDTRFELFLTGDFLFEDSHFNRLEEMNFFSELKEWYQYNLVAFMRTADPINWQLESTLADIHDNHSGFIRPHLVDSSKNQSILSHYKLRNIPAVILFDGSDEIRRWHPASNPEKIRRECEEFIKDQQASN